MEGDHGEEGEEGVWDLRKLRERDNLTSPWLCSCLLSDYKLLIVKN